MRLNASSCPAVILVLALAWATFPAPPAGAAAPGYALDYYDADKAYNGTTLFTDNHDTNAPRVVQVNMQGDVVWEYLLPTNLRYGIGPGFDAELLTNGHILVVVSRKGLFEIDRAGDCVWSNMDPKISHDADRLPNGDTLYGYGDADRTNEAVVKIVSSNGVPVWRWFATNEYMVYPFWPESNVAREGWTHCNAATPMPNGDVLISLRNFNLTIQVDTNGHTVWSVDWTNVYPGASLPQSLGYDPHEPEFLAASNHLLVCLQRSSPVQLAEIDRVTTNVAWSYFRDGLRTTRDGDRLPNGNTLVVGVLTQAQEHSVIFEVTPDSNIVWQLRLTNREAALQPGFFFKAQRVDDYDQDGLQDALDPDDDNDGVTDADEFAAGTSPTNALDYFRIEDIQRVGLSAAVLVSWQSVTDRTYSVYRWTNLLAPWPTNVLHESAGDGSVQSYTNYGPSPSRVFWRLGVGP